MSAPLFQHRHYVAIASILAELHNAAVATEGRAAMVDVIWTFADRLADTNPKFNRARFIACASDRPSNGRDMVRS